MIVITHIHLTEDQFIVLSMKIRINDINLRDAIRFDGFSSLIFNCKIKYRRFNKMLNNIRLKLKTSIKFV